MMRAEEQGEFLIVTNIHLILPPAKCEQGAYAMEPSLLKFASSLAPRKTPSTSSSPERAISTPVHVNDGSNTGGAMSVTLDEIAQFFYGRWGGCSGWHGTQEELIGRSYRTKTFPGKPFCLVKQWIIADTPAHTGGARSSRINGAATGKLSIPMKSSWTAAGVFLLATGFVPILEFLMTTRAPV